MAKKVKSVKDVEVEETKKPDYEVTINLDEEEEKKEKKEKITVERDEKEGFFRGVRKELKKVVWPKGGDIVKYTFAVIVMCLLLVGFFTVVQALVAFIKGLFV